MLAPEDLAFLIAAGQRWVAEQRRLHRPLGSKLAAADLEVLSAYFPARLLDQARLRIVPRIEGPDLPPEAPEAARRFNFANAAGIAFGDTILLTQSHGHPTPERLPLLFHELVHSAQADFLGLDLFIAHYVRTWAEVDFSYPDIPFEAQAFELEGRFAQGPSEAPFSVVGEVEGRFGYLV